MRWCRAARATPAPGNCSLISAGSRTLSPSACTTEEWSSAPAQLRASADVTGDAHELRRRLAEDGYLFLPGILNAGWAREAAQDVMGVMQRKGWLDTGPEPGNLAARAPIPAIYGPEWRELYVAVHHVETLHRLGFDPGLQACLTRLMGADVFVLPRRIVRLIGPVCAGGPSVG